MKLSYQRKKIIPDLTGGSACRFKCSGCKYIFHRRTASRTR